MRSTRSKRAFTLVELLVVIVVIGILASLVLTALAKAKYMAQMTICRNNLRQVALGLQVYRTDHGEFPVHDGDLREPGGPHWWWKKLGLPSPQFLQPNPGPKSLWSPRIGGVFACPLNQGRVETTVYGPGTGGLDGQTLKVRFPSIISYGYNAYGVGGYAHAYGVGGFKENPQRWDAVQRATTEAMVRRPSDLIVLGDEFSRSKIPLWDGHAYFSWGSPVISAAAIYVVNEPMQMPAKKQPAFVNHRGRANRAFADGHLELEDMRKQFTATDEQLKRWNVDNEPHRDVMEQSQSKR